MVLPRPAQAAPFDSHAMEIKPRTLLDYRACIRLYVTPRIGHLPLRAVRPSTITKLYRDLLTSGGRDGQPPRSATVTHLNAVFRKAFRDAVIVDELIGSNLVKRAKRPRAQVQEPGTVWITAQLRAFLATARQHGLFAFFHVAASTGARRGELLNLRWTDIDLDAKKIIVTGSTAVIGSERINGSTKSGARASSPSMTKRSPSCASTGPTRPPSSCKRATPGAEPRMGPSSRLAGASRSTPIPSHR